jgi:bifunctional DNA-binding transcriptional regulator/antitoxin component of YhaV-PrlF toxin-antitoxin module
MEVTKLGKRGTMVLPANLRRRYGFEEGSVIVAEEHADGILIRPAVVVPVETYTAERKAEFLLNNAVDADDYQAARVAVQGLGLDPDSIQHLRP